MKRFILIFLFISVTLFSEPQPYHFINLPYGTFLFELPKWREIISPYKNCDCNMYDGYIHSCFMEISSTKTSELIKRIGNDKQKHCESHYWRRAIGWLNEDEILVNEFSDGDGGAGDRWNSSKEKVNYSTGKITQLYKYIHLSCKSDADNRKISLTELRSFNKIFIYWEEKIYESKVPIFNSSIRYDREADAYDCKLNFKKMKPTNSESVIIYKEAN